VDQKCVCADGKSKYSETQSQCVGLLGENCIQGKCVESSICGPNSTCECKNTSYAYNGSCLPKKSYNHSCSSDEECSVSPEFPLKCVDGICDCDPQITRYDNVVSFVEEVKYYSRYHCDYNCRRNTLYDENLGMYVKKQWVSKGMITQCVGKAANQCRKHLCVQNALCETNTCVCQADFVANSMGLCAKKYKASCSKKTPCTDGLNCIDGHCQCKYPDHSEFKDGACRRFVGAHCKIDSDCVENSVCHLFTNATVGLCECKTGFVQNVQKRCDLAFGSECPGTGKDTIACDTIAELRCVNGECACADEGQKYDPTKRTCVGLVGTNCPLINDQYACTDNSVCMSSLKSLDVEAPLRCMCMPGFIPNEEYECIVDTDLEFETFLQMVQADEADNST